ncbi:ABC transporter ATP-binding protein [Fodinicola acaciae]|uniref:ABC transporter ATP-binding protein n=1 Tax=Fodinicola acaciae TaxID=2681555 RepID=UPI0013D29EC1|nr:ABC transporter ATP-binding protein [Fodinicola acaciae]
MVAGETPTKTDHRRILRIFTPYGWPLAGLAALIVFSSATGIFTPFIVRSIVDDALANRDLGLLLLLVGALIGLAAVAALIQVVEILIASRVGQAVMHDLRVRVYGHLQRLSLRFFTASRTGEVQSRISNDIGGMQSLVTHSAVELTRSAGAVCVSAIAMLALDWKLALFSFLALPLSIWVNRRIGSIRERVTARQQARLADLSSLVQESLSVQGVVLSKTTGRSGSMIARFTRMSWDVARLEVRSHTAGQWEYSLVILLVSAMPALTYLLGGVLLGVGAPVTIGTLVAMIALQEALIWPLEEVLEFGVEYKSATALFARVFDYLDRDADIVEARTPVVPDAVRGNVRLTNVTFGYSAELPPVLRDIDLEIPAGSRLGIVGATGSGKSSLGYLLVRLYDVDAGSVTIDGVDVRELSFESLAGMIGVVTQEPYLFHASVAENLRFGKEDATPAELEAAARVAQLHDVVAALPDGYDTIVGERGYRFSGGEKQRLALARILLRDTPILLLDEATSALDAHTERAITEALHTSLAGRTIITIAHRLSTVRDADRIIVLHNGDIIESGTHDELVARNGRYSALVGADR